MFIWLADFYGRNSVFLISHTMTTLMIFVNMLTKDIRLLMTSLFMISFASVARSQCAYLMIIELCPKNQKLYIMLMHFIDSISPCLAFLVFYMTKSYIVVNSILFGISSLILLIAVLNSQESPVYLH